MPFANQDIAEQLEGHMPFGVALTQADEITLLAILGPHRQRSH